MPIYKYECKDCGKVFETLVMGNSTPECPECKSKNLEKKLSTFNSVSSSSNNSNTCSTGTCSTGTCPFC